MKERLLEEAKVRAWELESANKQLLEEVEHYMTSTQNYKRKFLKLQQKVEEANKKVEEESLKTDKMAEKQPGSSVVGSLKKLGSLKRSSKKNRAAVIDLEESFSDFKLERPPSDLELLRRPFRPIDNLENETPEKSRTPKRRMTTPNMKENCKQQ